jgi:putative DNA primase/helicase
MDLQEGMRAYLECLWAAAQPLQRHDPVVRYLLQRSVLMPEGPYPQTLRYHARLAYRDDQAQKSRHPAMLAYIQRPDGSLAALHRTYLTPQGQKASVPSPKKMTPAVFEGAITGSAVRIAPAMATLGVCEGIETALSVQTYAQMPVWAALSATGLEHLELPPSVTTVVIWCDHDAPGIRAGRALATRLLRQGRTVKVLVPDEPGSDWADS